jgi:hypothetical protein
VRGAPIKPGILCQVIRDKIATLRR